MCRDANARQVGAGSLTSWIQLHNWVAVGVLLASRDDAGARGRAGWRTGERRCVRMLVGSWLWRRLGLPRVGHNWTVGCAIGGMGAEMDVEDRELLRRAREGDAEAFGRFFRARSGLVLGFLRPRVASA